MSLCQVSGEGQGKTSCQQGQGTGMACQSKITAYFLQAALSSIHRSLDQPQQNKCTSIQPTSALFAWSPMGPFHLDEVYREGLRSPLG